MTFWQRIWREILFPWMRLLRVSNLLTVVGDPLAGAFLTLVLTGATLSIPRLLDVIVCSLLLYSFGIIENDYCDLAEDRRRRKERPLPRGEISVFSALLVSLAMLCSALLLAYWNGGIVLFVAVVLACMINLYNLLLKQDLMRGAVCMGLCRSFNMLMGVCVVEAFSFPVLFPVVASGVYIVYVTLLASTEHRPSRVGLRLVHFIYPFVISWGMTLPFLLGKCTLVSLGYSLGCLVVCCLGILFLVGRLHHCIVSAGRMQACIGGLLGCLIPWQVSWMVLYASRKMLLVVLLFAAIWGLYLWAGRHIRQS